MGHARYQKFYYQEPLEIVRVRCTQCRVTHALIPAFSLPGTSSGTQEAEGYLLDRQAGVGRGIGGQGLEAHGLGEQYRKWLDRRFARCIQQAKAFFPLAGDPTLAGTAWIASVTGYDDRPLHRLNGFCLAHQVNAIGFNRVSILQFSCLQGEKGLSHNLSSPPEPPQAVDSS